MLMWAIYFTSAVRYCNSRGLAPPEVRSKDRKTASWFGNLPIGRVALLEKFYNTCFKGLAVENLQPWETVMESRKCYHGSPTRMTPVRPTKRAAGRPRKSKAKKQLMFSRKSTSSKVVVDEWSKKEDKALVQFVLLTGTGSAWPSTKSSQYWEKAAKFVHQQWENQPQKTSK